jgi:hypothetical protein
MPALCAKAEMRFGQFFTQGSKGCSFTSNSASPGACWAKEVITSPSGVSKSG